MVGSPQFDIKYAPAHNSCIRLQVNKSDSKAQGVMVGSPQFGTQIQTDCVLPQLHEAFLSRSISLLNCYICFFFQVACLRFFLSKCLSQFRIQVYAIQDSGLCTLLISEILIALRIQTLLLICT